MELLDMGKYTPYVWSCFGLAFAVLVHNEWRARSRQKRMYRDIEVRVRASEGRE